MAFIPKKIILGGICMRNIIIMKVSVLLCWGDGGVKSNNKSWPSSGLSLSDQPHLTISEDILLRSHVPMRVQPFFIP